MSYWDIGERGFLPETDPCINLLHAGKEFTPLMVEYLGKCLPNFLDTRKVRQELVASLRSANAYRGSKLQEIDPYINWINGMEEDEAERAMMLFSYFASAYIHATHENTADYLPVEIAGPLVYLSECQKREPVLSYASYCLSNWRRIDPSKPIELGNIELLQHFTPLEEGRIRSEHDEDWFVLVHVDIEARGAKAIKAINSSRLSLYEASKEDLREDLSHIAESMWDVNNTFKRMPEHCSAEVYFKHVRPYIFGYKVHYEGACAQDWKFPGGEVELRGETGAQSSLIPAVQIALGIEHNDSILTTHLRDMRKYMPKPHRDWLESLENAQKDDSQGPAIRGFAERNGLRAEYNECVKQVADFRRLHLSYAVDYIEKKVDNPTGTGGTPYIKWLSQLVEETEGFMI